MVLKLLAPCCAALALTAILGFILLPLLVRLHVGQSIRSDGPKRHLSKAGTPTMGGLVFIPAALLVCLFLPDKTPALGLWVLSFLGFGLIGFLDDFAKLRHHENKGLSGKQKLAGQFAAIALLLLFHGLTDPAPTAIHLFSDQVWLDLGWWYYPIMAVLMVGTVNAVNLTDGLDGLVSGVSIPVYAGFMLALANAASPALSMMAAAMAGCCGGFLIFNHYPARLFMGDTGSMALGGAVVGLALGGGLEVLMIGFGLVYMLEALSVMLQVGSFQLTGKRIFLMAPIHHHFELKGMKETEVTALFWIASAIFVFLTLLLYMIF